MKSALVVLVMVVVAAGTAYTQTVTVPPPPLPSAPRLEAIQGDPKPVQKEQSIDQLLEQIVKLRQQQAVLKKQEQDLTDLLHKKLGKQTELLNSLGLGTSALQPGASTAPNIGGILPAIPTPGSSAAPV